MNCTWRVEHKHGHWHRLFLTVVARDRMNQIVPPRTKKNSPIPITLKNGRQIILPSSDFKKWERAATRSMLLCFIEMRQQGLMGLGDFVNVEAKIYRQINQGDTNGFTQAIGDWLESSGVLLNDRQIESWDGTERLKDKDCPRVELCLTFLWPAKTKKAKREPRRVEPVLAIQTGLPLLDALGNTQE